MKQRSARRLGLIADRSGMALTEFGLCLPLLVTAGLYGLETVNLAYATQKLGGIATLTADNISRVRIGISEADVTETLTGMQSSGGGLGFAANGRIIVSSVQPIIDDDDDDDDEVTNHKIRWQRCIGSLSASSSYGLQNQNVGRNGMGSSDRRISATPGTNVIFVEVMYRYQPLISAAFVGTPLMRSVSSMTVRERISEELQNSGTASTC